MIIRGTWLFTFLFFLSSFAFAQHGVTPMHNSAFRTIDSSLREHWESQISTAPGLPRPFITAFAKAPFMFYWDTYFINKGLIAENKIGLAKDNVLDLLAVVDRYGYMGNAAITSWGMNRSQPPYLSSMVMDVFRATHDTAFIKYAYPVLVREYRFWTDSSSTAIESHITSIEGLQRFGNHAKKGDLITLYRELKSRFGWAEAGNDSARVSKALPYATEAESGMDFTPRFSNHCPDYIPVELNTLLFKMELDLGRISIILGLAGEPEWSKLARRRKALVDQYCWDEQKGLYFDYNFKLRKKSEVASLASFQPLWADMSSKHQAAKVRANLAIFLTDYGLRTTADRHTSVRYQWGYSSIWAPMQLIAADGLNNYGYTRDAKRLARCFLVLVQRNYDHPKSSNDVVNGGRNTGNIYEKYKVDGTINDDEYQANVMMGWTAGVFSYFYNFLTSHTSQRQDASGQLGQHMR